MIQLLATKYQKRIAFLLFFVFDLSFMCSSVRANNGAPYNRFGTGYENRNYSSGEDKGKQNRKIATQHKTIRTGSLSRPVLKTDKASKSNYIDGPSQPEMSSFKSVGTNNMVNLFTGDFSYNIPLLDVGGYPVNIYYNGGIGMEQEASWVGLGWNINPGNVNRNMRGIPDDFDGTDTLLQWQNMKPNKTWGFSTAGDLELVGIKDILGIDLGASLGVSFNNYLGPAVDLGLKEGITYKIGGKVGAEKSAVDSVSMKLSVSENLNSRDGVTISPNASLTAKMFSSNSVSTAGIGASTSYNSRTGVKALQLNEQMSFNSAGSIGPLGTKTTQVLETIGNMAGNFSNSITFAKPSYFPAIRMPLTNNAISGRFQLGGALWGVYVSGEIQLYEQSSSVSADMILQKKPMVGFLYYEKAVANPNAVMDFTRFNDREVTPNTPIISAPQYSYDVFSIQGEGTGGSIRAYRDDLGTVRDNTTGSKDKNQGVGVDIGIPGHYGANYNIVQTPTQITEWGPGNQLHSTIAFQAPTTGIPEKVYFRNPGEGSVLNPSQFNRIGGVDLVRYRLGGDGYNPTVVPLLNRFAKDGTSKTDVNVVTTSFPQVRKKRSQVIDFLTADDASQIGLDKSIKTYDAYNLLDGSNKLNYSSFARNSGYRKGHHISQINVTESTGKRYVYGIPVYNTMQKDFTFSVSGTTLSNADDDKITYDPNDMSPAANSALIDGLGSPDGYVQVMQTPAYAHSFLLSGLLSSDYVDVTGDGITEDDLGDAVKFNYTLIRKPTGDIVPHKWRTPVDTSVANFNSGKRTETKDDKGIVSYGERESWYMHSIESKTMIAFFILENRRDGKGVKGENGKTDPSDTSLKRLKEIRLYSKADLAVNGLSGAKPIKTVNFVYSYRLCRGTPDNPTSSSVGVDSIGKLCLDEIYFTFNGQYNKVNKNRYVFNYGDSARNPDYRFNSSDRWGSYKPEWMNPQTYSPLSGSAPQNLKNSYFPYSTQDPSKKDSLNVHAGAWALKNILLPSGGQLDICYEADDYAYVQNMHAADMMHVVGFSDSPTGIVSNRLYNLGLGPVNNDYLFVRVPVACHNAADVYQKYIAGLSQISVKLAVNMPKGIEHLNSYATIDSSAGAGYGVTSDTNTVWIKLSEVSGFSPLSLTALEYLREQLPGQAYKSYDVSDEKGLEQLETIFVGMLDDLRDAFKDPMSALRDQHLAEDITLDQTFARLNDPDGFKYGGGYRVKSIKLRDNWQKMTQQYNTCYEQDYDYTKTEVFNGVARTISSGVASYEPSIGGDENPFQNIVLVANKLPLGPTSYGSIEMPVLDAFFPAPLVGYSQVTVRSVPSVKPNPDSGQVSHSMIGRQVTEFYTAKDYPVYCNYTPLDPLTDVQAHHSSSTAFFYTSAFDSRALSQGFLVENNDMHGKMKSQSSYAANDTTLRVNYTENFYRNTGGNGLNEKFNFVSSSLGGVVDSGNIGIDVELMTDTREFTVSSHSLDIQGQLDLFPVIFPFWLPFIWPVVGNGQNNYRAVTTTKVVDYHSILDSVVVYDKGSVVSTKNMVYDGETGDVIVTRTNNEFEKPLYSTTYPAWWAYSGMGPAFYNTGMIFNGVNFLDGKITNAGFDQSQFESGDELFAQPIGPNDSCYATLTSVGTSRIWALDKNKDTLSLTDNAPNFIFIDSSGHPYTNKNVSCRIVRSGKRNLLDQKAAVFTSMASPVVTTGGSMKLVLDTNAQVLNASAVLYREKWQTDRDAIFTLKAVQDTITCIIHEIPDCNGYLEKHINPYLKGLLGNFRNNKSLVFYGNRVEQNINTLSKNGLLASFSSYWHFNGSHNLAPDTTNTNWVWKDEVMRFNAKGMELETRNALNIYTAAQYGYNKTLPTAIVNNARYDQMAYEGFEDNGYNNYIDNENVLFCSNQQHLDLSFMANSNVINTDSMGFRAHTGKYVLGVNSGTSGVPTVASQTFAVTDTVNHDFNLKFGSGILTHLDSIGGNATAISVSPYYAGAPVSQTYVTNQSVAGFTNGGSSIPLSLANATSTNPNGTTRYQHNFSISIMYYIQVTSAGDYYFSIGLNGNGYTLGANDVENISYTVQDLNGNVMDRYTGNGIVGAASNIHTVHLCPGILQITANYQNTFDYSGASGLTLSTAYTMAFSTNAADIDYKNLSTANGCSYTVPIAASDSMMHPKFSLPGGQQMVFSAWVHEDSCGIAKTGGVCNQSGFSHNHVVIGDGITSVSIYPSGPILDGWQRYEGYFTASTSATTGSIQFYNTSGQVLYFDDIRIFPFNADMKSYVYDPISLRLVAELDANNYASFYEYDEEGTLIRTKAETIQGIKTIKETRSSTQSLIKSVQ